MDRRDQVRARQRQQVVRALEVARPVREALAAVIGGLEPGALDHRAHRAVEHEDALRERGLERGDPRLSRVAHAAARSPSAWQIA